MVVLAAHKQLPIDTAFQDATTFKDSQIFEPDGGQLYDETKKDGRDKKI